MNKHTHLALLTLLVFGGSVSLAGGPVGTVASPDMRRPMPMPTSVSYEYDQQLIKNLVAQPSSLLKVQCNIAAILKNLGYTEGKSKLLSIGVLDEQFEYNYDFRSCSLRLSNRNASRGLQKIVTEEQALNIAQKFASSLQGNIYSQLGKPLIIGKNHGGIIQYAQGGAILKEDNMAQIPFNDIEIDDTQEEELKKEYTSYSILFPMLIDKKMVYNQRGQAVGLTVEVNAEGVLSANAQLLPFKGSKTKAEKMSADGLISFINQGGNSPYYGNAESINFAKPERVYVLFTVQKGNTFDTYIGHGIKLASDVNIDQRATQPYQLVISDFKIGNMINY